MLNSNVALLYVTLPWPDRGVEHTFYCACTVITPMELYTSHIWHNVSLGSLIFHAKLCIAAPYKVNDYCRGCVCVGYIQVDKRLHVISIYGNYPPVCCEKHFYDYQQNRRIPRIIEKYIHEISWCRKEGGRGCWSGRGQWGDRFVRVCPRGGVDS